MHRLETSTSLILQIQKPSAIFKSHKKSIGDFSFNVQVSSKTWAAFQKEITNCFKCTLDMYSMTSHYKRQQKFSVFPYIYKIFFTYKPNITVAMLKMHIYKLNNAKNYRNEKISSSWDIRAPTWTNWGEGRGGGSQGLTTDFKGVRIVHGLVRKSAN